MQEEFRWKGPCLSDIPRDCPLILLGGPYRLRTKQVLTFGNQHDLNTLNGRDLRVCVLCWCITSHL